MKKTFHAHFLFVMLVGALAGLLCLPAIAAETTGQDMEKFEARQLWQIFKESHNRAEQELVGKTVQIQGVVIETGTSIYLTPNVRLSDTANGQIYVTCVLPRSDSGLLSSFRPGEQVTMKGRVYRFSSNEYVVIKESQRVKK